MSNPFDLDAPALIAFSGGRSSGLMLWRILRAGGGALPPGVGVVFCNTGRERPETLDFVEECSRRWACPITWLEYRRRGGKHTYDVTDYASASRDGRPFDEVIAARKFCPNRVARFCTAELKVKTMWRWAKDCGLASYTKAVGLRADEPERVRRLLAGVGETRAAEEVCCPLSDAGLTVQDVRAFWGAQPFDLCLLPHESNCDLCFLKRKGALLEIMHRRPDLARWWVDKEAAVGLFRAPGDRPRYELLLREAVQPGLFDGLASDLDADDPSGWMECACTD